MSLRNRRENPRWRRQREAQERKVLRGKRTPMEQIRLLDERLGVGKGAKKERAKLRQEMKLKRSKKGGEE